MSETEYTVGYQRAEAAREISTAQLFGQVMFLVAVAIGMLALGTFLGQDLSQGTALACSLAGFGMLLVSSFAGERFRVGTFAIGWLYATAVVIGLGLGPTLSYLVEVGDTALFQAAAGTALTVVGMGAVGFLMSKDLARWMRPLSLVVLGAVGVSLVMLVLNFDGSPIISLVIYAASAALIMVDLNYLRKHGTERDAVWLATGIFVSIVNIFLSLLNLFGE
jgi:modulator of FtsH protease